MQSRYPPNETWRWCPTDTEARYQLNRAERADDLRQHGWWDHDPFDYHFNSSGFRSDEFDHRPGTLYLGCSFTLGIGLPHGDTWASQVSDALGTACWNLGQGKGSMDTCFRLAEHWIPRLRPTRVMMLCPMAERMELVDAQGFPGFYTALDHDTPMIAAWLKHPDNSRLNYSKNLRAIKQICNEHTIPFHAWSITDLLDGKEAAGLARDLQHVGVEYHLKFAERVLGEIDAHGVD